MINNFQQIAFPSFVGAFNAALMLPLQVHTLHSNANARRGDGEEETEQKEMSENRTKINMKCQKSDENLL